MGFIALAEILLRPSTVSKKPNFYDLSLQFRSLFHHFFHHSSKLKGKIIKIGLFAYC
jgi:hypothetical protein